MIYMSNSLSQYLVALSANPFGQLHTTSPLVFTAHSDLLFPPSQSLLCWLLHTLSAGRRNRNNSLGVQKTSQIKRMQRILSSLQENKTECTTDESTQSASLHWPKVGSGSYGWLLVGVGFITLNQRWANVYYPRYQMMYRIRWLDLLDQRWANVCSPHYHRLLEYVGCHLLDQHWANVWSLHYDWLLEYVGYHLLDQHWANVRSLHYHWLLEYVGCHLLDQHWANACSWHYHNWLSFVWPTFGQCSLHYHKLLEYVSQTAWWLYDWYWLVLELQRVTNISLTYVWIRTSTKLNATKCQLF